MRSCVLDASDNQAAVQSFARGRSRGWILNRECRRKAALEGAFDIHERAGWVDAQRQPADGGTRPDARGKLNIEKPLWVCAQLFLEVFAGCAGITYAMHRAGIESSESWDILYHSRFNVLNDKKR